MDKVIGRDASGFDILTRAVKSLLNQYPGLEDGEVIKFEELGKESGIAFSADNGALVYAETEDVCGFRHQKCQYPFYVVYRTASNKERLKLSAQEFLDSLGKWLCQEPVVINGTQTRLAAFPALSEGRIIKRITRENSYGLEPNADAVQDWVLPVTVQYTNDIEYEA
nr:MAG TPA: Minor capsid protein from bacteriophage [Caudoviricetes sp.]DAH22937.1 MAG TPA: Minor capsid protein from bacteriophage [Bacteriophage sp.]DAT57178.1 MAG TPA: Minor capsid protein from bacteriophage [Caudoviricetes sp.]DAU56084.1 MAG TPA: Minor capsid protein from bacteriophage [Caudoviricetes sp.]